MSNDAVSGNKGPRESVAAMGEVGPFILGVSDEIHWDDVVTIRGYDVSVRKAVELGLEHGMDIAAKLEKDLNSDEGLLVTFPLQYLMSELQDIVGSGEALLERVKP